MALSITTWNCGGITFETRERIIAFIDQNIDSDILCLQETCFVSQGCPNLGLLTGHCTNPECPRYGESHPIQHNFVDSLHPEYQGTAWSLHPLKGRPEHFGGMAILWKKSLHGNVDVLDDENYLEWQNNLCGIELTFNGEKTLVLSCYIPPGEYSCPQARYDMVADIVAAYGEDPRYHNVILCGDYNIKPGEVGFQELVQKCHDKSVFLADYFKLNCFTTTKRGLEWPDHFIVSSFIADKSRFRVIEKVPEGQKRIGHYPLTMTVEGFKEVQQGPLISVKMDEGGRHVWRRYHSEELRPYGNRMRLDLKELKTVKYVGWEGLSGKYFEDFTNTFVVPCDILMTKTPSRCVIHQTRLVCAEDTVLKLEWYLRLESYVDKQILLVTLIPHYGSILCGPELFKCVAKFQIGSSPEDEKPSSFFPLRQSLVRGRVTAGSKPWIISIPDLLQLQDEFSETAGENSFLLRVTLRTVYDPLAPYMKVSDPCKPIRNKNSRHRLMCRSNQQGLITLHTEILRGRSSQLKKLTEDNSSVIVITSDDIDTLTIFGHYLTHGLLPLNLTYLQLCDLISTAHKFGLIQLKQFCFRHLVFTQTDETITKSVLVAHFWDGGEEVKSIIENYIQRKFSIANNSD